MIRYSARFRYPEKAARPLNQVEAEKLSPLINPISAEATDLMIDIETPDGQVFAINDPRLIEHLRSNLNPKPDLTLLRSDKALTDCCPLSIISLQSVETLSQEAGVTLDKRRFRANVYLDFNELPGFAENTFVGRSLRIGTKVVVRVIARDTRCMMITLDPDTAKKTPAILKTVGRDHEGKAGVYGAVLAEGMIHKGDAVEILE
jgi:hypothetical protein